LKIREPLRRLKIELVTLGAIVLRFGMLMMAQIAIQLRSVMRRRVRVARLHVFGFFRKLFRRTVAGDALLHRQGLRRLGLAVAFNAVDIGQLVPVATRQLTRQAEIIFGVAGPAGFPVHGFGVSMPHGQHLFLQMAAGAISAFDGRLGQIQFWRGPEELNQRNDKQDAQ